MKIRLFMILTLVVSTNLYAEQVGTSSVDITKNYYQALAEQGSGYAQLAIGEMYLNGDGVAKDHITAYAWFAVAAAQGVEEAKHEKDYVYQELKQSQRSRAMVLANRFKEKYVQ